MYRFLYSDKRIVETNFAYLSEATIPSVDSVFYFKVISQNFEYRDNNTRGRDNNTTIF